MINDDGFSSFSVLVVVFDEGYRFTDIRLSIQPKTTPFLQLIPRLTPNWFLF
jgi:hypothetical protein